MYFKIQKGFHVDDYISIDESELPMAVRAQVSGKVGIFKEGTISGDKIISITPDWNREMGWNRDYRLGNEDYAQIGQKKMEDYRNYIELTIENTKAQLEGRPPVQQIETSDLGKRLGDKFGGKDDTLRS